MYVTSQTPVLHKVRLATIVVTMNPLHKEEWDFSSLAVPTEKKGQKKSEKADRRQVLALTWELARERGRAAGNMKPAWLSLTHDQQQAHIRPNLPRTAVRELSLIELSSFVRDFNSTPASKSHGMATQVS